MRSLWLAVMLVWGCSDASKGPPDARPDAPRCPVPIGDLFGETCTQPPFPEIGGCRPDKYAPNGFRGGCSTEPEGSFCRPWCDVGGIDDCLRRGGVRHSTDRGACVCVACE